MAHIATKRQTPEGTLATGHPTPHPRYPHWLAPQVVQLPWGAYPRGPLGHGMACQGPSLPPRVGGPASGASAGTHTAPHKPRAQPSTVYHAYAPTPHHPHHATPQYSQPQQQGEQPPLSAPPIANGKARPSLWGVALLSSPHTWSNQSEPSALRPP